jgi:CheY-like chemotaxis protein
MNLGTNAWQALPGGVGWIEFGLEPRLFQGGDEQLPSGLAPGEYAHLWVRDNGKGMDERTREHIFEPFFTTKSVGQGTGLGLAVVHGILEAHSGAVGVTTALGRGSVFDLYLPLVDEDSGFVDLPSDPEQTPRGAGQHVLYIDDDEVMALTVHSLLQRLGYRATCTLDAQEALAAVELALEHFDLVVTDFNMPHVSGLEVARRLLALRPGLPVVISSGYITDELRASAAAVGVRAVMQKENTFEELASLVHRIVGAAPG